LLQLHKKYKKNPPACNKKQKEATDIENKISGHELSYHCYLLAVDYNISCCETKKKKTVNISVQPLN
jgi:hypothetical protein